MVTVQFPTGMTEKTTPIAADILLIGDSADGNKSKKSNVSDVLAAYNDQIATMSNKIINSADNSIVNISNTNIQAGAAINATKIADGTVDNTEFQYLGGVTSNIQTQLNSKGTGNGDVVGPASATDGVPALFDLTTGKLLKNSTPTGTGNPVLATSPTLSTPILGVATATSINKVAITAPATASTLTIADGKTLTANKTLTLDGTDSTTMTFPTTSKTIAANDGSNLALASQATGDLLVASSASAYTRLAIGTSGFALHSNGTTSAWETDYALTFNYSLTTSVATGDVTVTLLNYLGTTPSATTPVRIRVGTTLVTYTSSTTLVVTNDGSFDFNSGGASFAAKEVDYFIYAASSNGLAMSRMPFYTNYAQKLSGQEFEIANGGSFTTQDLQVIGRVNLTKAAGTTGNWSIPATSIIINKPIYNTRDLTYVPTLSGAGGTIGTMTANPYEGVYSVSQNKITLAGSIKCTNVGSWSSNVQVGMPFTSKNQLGEVPITGWCGAVGTNPATGSRGSLVVINGSNIMRILSGIDSANLAWGTFVANDIVRFRGDYRVG